MVDIERCPVLVDALQQLLIPLRELLNRLEAPRHVGKPRTEQQIYIKVAILSLIIEEGAVVSLLLEEESEVSEERGD